MKRFLCLLLSISLYFPSIGQDQSLHTIKGTVADVQSRLPLENATVSLLSRSDSTIVNKTLSARNGDFMLSVIGDGSYLLQISYLGYEPVTKAIRLVSSHVLLNLDSVFLRRTGLTLTAIEIFDARKMMTLKKDTLEYDARFFKTRENAKLQDLFRKVPGIRMLRDGSIEVQGEVVKRIMIDGRPYFGNDPGVAIKTLPAEVIDKIQVVEAPAEENSDKSIGNMGTEKVINLTLKKEQHDKIFGDFMTAAGSDERFAVSGNVSRMGDHEQVTFLAGGNNNNNYTLSGPGAKIAQNNIGDNGGEGLSRNWTGGMNYNKDLSTRLKFSLGYQYFNIKTVTQQELKRQTLLPDTSFDYLESSSGEKQLSFHNIDARLSWDMDSMTSLRTAVKLSPATSNFHSSSGYSTVTPSAGLINQGNMYNAVRDKRLDFSFESGLTRKFREARRLLQATFSLRRSTNSSLETNESVNSFYVTGAVNSDSINQRAKLDKSYLTPQFKLLYREPLSKTMYLDIQYTYAPMLNSADKTTFTLDPAGKMYSVQIDSLSNYFNNANQVHLPGLAIGDARKRFDYTVGAFVQMTSMTNKNRSTGQQLDRRFNGIIPYASFNILFASNKRLRFNYQSSQLMPDITLLQPVPDNSNPLYVKLGNPDLKPSFSHYFRLSYNSFNRDNFQNISAQVTGQFLTNNITNTSVYDSVGRNISQPVNVNGNYYVFGNLLYNRPFKDQRGSFESNSYFKTVRDINLVNGNRSINNSFIASQQLTYSNTALKSFDWSAGTLLQYEGARYSLQREANTNFLTWSASLNSNLYLPLGFSTGFDMDYMLNSGRAAGYNVRVLMLNAYVCKNFGKNQQGELKLQGFDLFNQNNSIRRSVGLNFIEDVRTQVLQRFFMLSFTYYLKKKQDM